ncbi:MAG TPA: DUF503 domain-containing protein [Thermoanaerobaculia bacterium]|nr:DUF503 domain-containing protein [Thermoanaerobaculia bacterium]
MFFSLLNASFSPFFMLVSVALFEVHISQATSLKDKRRVVQSLKAGIRSRFEVSTAEVGLQELHQRSRIAVSFVTSDAPGAARLMSDIQRFVEEESRAVLTGWTEETLDFDENAALDVPGFRLEGKFGDEENS